MKELGSYTKGIVRRRTVEDLDEEGHYEYHHNSRVEVGHVEDGPQATHEGVGRDGCSYQTGRQLHAEALHETGQQVCASYTPLKVH